MFTSVATGVPYAEVFAPSSKAITFTPYSPVSNTKAVNSSAERLSSTVASNAFS